MSVEGASPRSAYRKLKASGGDNFNYQGRNRCTTPRPVCLASGRRRNDRLLSITVRVGGRSRRSGAAVGRSARSRTPPLRRDCGPDRPRREWVGRHATDARSGRQQRRVLRRRQLLHDANRHVRAGHRPTATVGRDPRCGQRRVRGPARRIGGAGGGDRRLCRRARAGGAAQPRSRRAVVGSRGGDRVGADRGLARLAVPGRPTVRCLSVGGEPAVRRHVSVLQ